MKNKLLNKTLVSLIAFGMILSHTSFVNALNEQENSGNIDDKIIGESSNNQNEKNSEENVVNNDNDKQTQSREIIGQTKFVDENGNIKIIDVYDGTTGEEFNQYSRSVSTSKMINFNSSKSESNVIEYTDYYTNQKVSLNKICGADAAYLGIEDDKIKFMISGSVGLIDLKYIEVVTQENYYASYYKVNSSGILRHYVSTDVTVEPSSSNYIGTAPTYLVQNIKYYSYDGHYFYTDYDVMINDYQNNTRSKSLNYDNPYYNYYQYLPFRSKTNYSSEEITQYINKMANSSNSKMNNIGDSLIKYQNQYGVNALLVASFAAMESGWGKSNIAIDKNNLFGIGAFDSDPYNKSYSFESVDECIKEFMSNWMSKSYLNAKYSDFRGGYLGDKASGIFVRYSTNPYEGEIIASIASLMDSRNGSKDKNYYTLGIKDVDLLNYSRVSVYKDSNLNSVKLYDTIANPAYSFIIRKKDVDNGYYQIQSDSVLDSNRNGVSIDSEYDYDECYGYVNKDYLTIINVGNDVKSNQAPVIESAEVTDVTAEGYTVTCKITDDYGIDRVLMPTWTDKNGQDDLRWYTVNKSGDIYTLKVKISNHNNESGTYYTHVYAYDTEGKQTKKELTISVPEPGKPEIKEVSVSTPTRTGYTVTCTVESSTELTKVQMPTWTDANGQDDLVWHSAKIEAQGNGKYKVSYTVKISDHKNESGKYITHIYAYNKAGKTGYYPILESINIPENQAPVIESAEVIDVTAEGYTVTCRITDDDEVEKVLMPTWTEKNEQDDLKWYNADKSGNVYTLKVKTSNHNNEGGMYNTHIYAYDKEGKYSKKELTVSVPEKGKPVIKDVRVNTPTRAGYTVTCTIESTTDLTRVLMPTWTEHNGQDDLVWHSAKVESQGSGEYKASYTVKASEHKNESGKYVTHIYAYNITGKEACYEISEDIEIPANQAPIVTNVSINHITSNSYKVTCDVSDDLSVTSVKMPTWTRKNDQDDIVWHEAEITNGIATFTVNRKDHNYEYGEYITHIYAYDGNGEQSSVDAGMVVLAEPTTDSIIIKDVYVSDENDEGFTITCTVTGNETVDRVLMPTWTYKNEQDDIIWHKANSIGENKYSCRILRKDHKSEFGTYVTHIYVYTTTGLENHIELNYHNIINTTVAQGWTYINGEKFFFDNEGNMVGNMPCKKVIDVSSYNGNIDWATAVKYGDIDGVIIRIVNHPNGSYQEDPQFANNLAACRKYNIPFGVYIYDYSRSTSDAYNEAEMIMSILKKYNVSADELKYNIYFDMERNQDSTGLNSQQMSDVAATFINRISNYGYKAYIYSYRSLLNEYLNTPYIWSQTNWLAAYTSSMGWNNPHYHGLFGWQYTSGGVIPGFSGNNGYVDISCWFEI